MTLEAQAMGVPVIGFDSGGVSYTVSEKTGVLVTQKNIKQLAEEIEKLVLDKSQYQSMSLEARKWVLDHYTISKMIHEYYADIL